MFIEHLSGPVLMMLGAKYNIEPFFFSSSLGWIPSRYEEEVRPGQGDHITITLTFLRPMDHPEGSLHTYPSDSSTMTSLPDLQGQVIDTQAPLFLHSSDIYLILDLLAVHLIRSTDGNTIISYHNPEADTTSATYLHERIRFAGQSNVPLAQRNPKRLIHTIQASIGRKYSSSLPIRLFVLLTFIWHAMYAWDESLELLYSHICYIDFRKAVDFVLNTPNPAMDSLPEEERDSSRRLLQRECKNLLSEINRLEQGRAMQDKRLRNVLNLVFSSLCGTVLMKQIAFLSMVFLPASFVAAIFGMNIREIAPRHARLALALLRDRLPTHDRHGLGRHGVPEQAYAWAGRYAIYENFLACHDVAADGQKKEGGVSKIKRTQMG
ncbi:hypothetical protein MVEN_01782600 [Mycena venus]|uniref:Uncharacterized protein n=1 Tax=Mycena venus TaxID=2733690 RepID=A0A8H6XK57_9AGAR|nr:hypothetical protein MVEN_01782600 [Mycena venus]